MSDGKKFAKTDANLTPEQRLEEVERKFSVIIERIQVYDEVLVKFDNINLQLRAQQKDLSSLNITVDMLTHSLNDYSKNLNAQINEIKKNQDLFSNSLNTQIGIHHEYTRNSQVTQSGIHHDIAALEENVKKKDMQFVMLQQSLSVLERDLSELIKRSSNHAIKLEDVHNDQSKLKLETAVSISELKGKIAKLLTSFQEMPQFNEWATKIYIRVCNEISEKQKEIYNQLDARSKQLKDQLASDPYTAESVKNVLKNEMEEMAMDGKNAYLKASNSAQQIQLLEKKIENINLILKKYELSK